MRNAIKRDDRKRERTEKLFTDGSKKFGWLWFRSNRAAIRAITSAGMKAEQNQLLGGLIAWEICRMSVCAVRFLRHLQLSHGQTEREPVLSRSAVIISGRHPMQWNPRYLAYVFASGATSVDECLARDDELYPGGKMCGFILWIQSRWREWYQATGVPPNAVLSADDHHRFDEWLAEEFVAPIPVRA